MFQAIMHVKSWYVAVEYSICFLDCTLDIMHITQSLVRASIFKVKTVTKRKTLKSSLQREDLEHRS